jgi:molybdopterin converting factor small subunit
MAITVELPGVLSPYARGSTLELPSAECATVADALAALASRHPGVVDRMMDERGELRPHVNLFVDDKNIRFGRGVQTRLGVASTIVVVPAVSGG